MHLCLLPDCCSTLFLLTILHASICEKYLFWVAIFGGVSVHIRDMLCFPLRFGHPYAFPYQIILETSCQISIKLLLRFAEIDLLCVKWHLLLFWGVYFWNVFCIAFALNILNILFIKSQQLSNCYKSLTMLIFVFILILILIFLIVILLSLTF